MKYLEENVLGFKDQVHRDKKYIHNTDPFMPKTIRSYGEDDYNGNGSGEPYTPTAGPDSVKDQSHGRVSGQEKEIPTADPSLEAEEI